MKIRDRIKGSRPPIGADTSCWNCLGRGAFHDHSTPWWKFWRRVTCFACDGSGILNSQRSEPADHCRLWIAGKYMGELESGAVVWEFQGVFQTEAEAVRACRTVRYFVAPAVLGQQLPDEAEIWPVAFYPLQPEKPMP